MKTTPEQLKMVFAMLIVEIRANVQGSTQKAIPTLIPFRYASS